MSRWGAATGRVRRGTARWRYLTEHHPDGKVRFAVMTATQVATTFLLAAIIGIGILLTGNDRAGRAATGFLLLGYLQILLVCATVALILRERWRAEDERDPEPASVTVPDDGPATADGV